MRILVFQHLAVEHPGVFRDFWAAEMHTWHAVALDENEPIPPLEPFDMLVSMGGPMDVWQEDAHPWLSAEKAAIRQWVLDLRRPFLGICLGHQLLADALGGTVEPMKRAEVGLANVRLTDEGRADPIFRGFALTLSTFQWHGAEVSKVPDGSVILASNDACIVQAFRYGRCAYGLQYHCELTPTTVDDWHSIPEYAASLDQALGPRASTLASDVEAQLASLQHSARRLNKNLLALAKHAKMPLPSRMSD